MFIPDDGGVGRGSWGVGEAHGHDFVIEGAVLLRARGAPLALRGEAILVGARDVVPFGDPLGRLAEGDRPVLRKLGIHEPPADGGIRDLRRGAIPGLAGLEHHVGRAGHGLHAAGDDALALARHDGLRGTGDRLEPRAAEPVDRLAWDFDRQARKQRRHARDVAVVFARAVGAAEDHVVDQDRIDRGALEQRADRDRGEVIGTHGRQRATVSADGRADGVDDYSATHTDLVSR